MDLMIDIGGLKIFQITHLQLKYLYLLKNIFSIRFIKYFIGIKLYEFLSFKKIGLWKNYF